jgi:hypothetical protein
MTKKPARTQYFDATATHPKYPGRHLYKMKDAKRPVMRWWNGSGWQYNRRKALTFKPAKGDQWAGAAELTPEVEKMLAMGLASSDKQPVKIDAITTVRNAVKKHQLSARA